MARLGAFDHDLVLVAAFDDAATLEAAFDKELAGAPVAPVPPVPPVPPAPSSGGGAPMGGGSLGGFRFPGPPCLVVDCPPEELLRRRRVPWRPGRPSRPRVPGGAARTTLGGLDATATRELGADLRQRDDELVRLQNRKSAVDAELRQARLDLAAGRTGLIATLQRLETLTAAATAMNLEVAELRAEVAELRAELATAKRQLATLAAARRTDARVAAYTAVGALVGAGTGGAVASMAKAPVWVVVLSTIAGGVLGGGGGYLLA